MSGLARHALVWLVTLAIIASGAAWYHDSAIQSAAPGVVAAENAVDHTTAGHNASEHGALHQTQAPDVSADPAEADHDCTKCCSVCTFAALTLPVASDAVIFTASQAVFFFDRQNWLGRPSAVEPDIPKTIV